MGKKVVVSAPGKLMLMGEHAVVYNRPCLVTAVDKRVNTTAEIIDKNEFQLEARDVGIVGYKKPLTKIGKGDIPKGARFVEMAVANFLSHPEFISGSFSLSPDSRLSGRRAPLFAPSLASSGEGQGEGEMLKQVQHDRIGMRIKTGSEFSPKLGFGSSSAATACVIKAISELFNLNLSKKEIFDLAYKTVLDIQGKGSGFDVAAAVYGGTLYFVTGGKLIESLDIKSLPLVVGYSGIKADTVSVINKVKKDFANRQDRLKEIYNRIEVLVNQGKEALIKTDWETLGKLMNKNQESLRELGVSIEKLDNMIKGALDGGAYGAKLSGAGGGDCMITIVGNEKKERVREAVRRVEGEVIDVETGVEGVRTE